MIAAIGWVLDKTSLDVVSLNFVINIVDIEDFHSKVLEATKSLHLKEHLVFEGSRNVLKLAALVECKGIVECDDQHLFLDSLRAQAAETTKSKETNPQGAENLVMCSRNATDADKPDLTKEEKTGDAKEVASATDEPSDPYEKIVFSPNTFTKLKLVGNLEELASDEDNASKVSLYLIDTMLPKFIQDLCMLEVSPMDGQTLTKKLHAHGINVCYISNVAGGTIHLPHLWELHNNEIVVKYARHVIKDLLQDTGVQDHALAISHSYYAYSFFEKQIFIDDVLQKGENVAANGSGILLVLAQKLLQGENHSQVQKIMRRFTAFLSTESQEILVERLGSDLLDPGGRFYATSILPFNFFKIWDPGGSPLFFSIIVSL